MKLLSRKRKSPLSSFSFIFPQVMLATLLHACKTRNLSSESVAALINYKTSNETYWVLLASYYSKFENLENNEVVKLEFSDRPPRNFFFFFCIQWTLMGVTKATLSTFLVHMRAALQFDWCIPHVTTIPRETKHLLFVLCQKKTNWTSARANSHLFARISL